MIVRSPDNGRLASCGADRAVILWDVGTGEILRRYTAHWEVNKFKKENGTRIKMMDIDCFILLHFLHYYKKRVNGVDFNEQGTVLVSGSFDATIRIWDCR